MADLTPWQESLLYENRANPYPFYAELRKTPVSRQPDGTYVEICEIADHPWYLGCQFHPEFKSKPMEPHPLFRSFIGAAYENGQRRRAQKEAAEIELFHRPERVGQR